MKQILSLSLVLIIALALVGCVRSTNNDTIVPNGTYVEATTDETSFLTAEELAFFNDNYFDILFEQEGYHINFSEGFRMDGEVKLTYRGYEPETGNFYEMMEHIITLRQDGDDYIFISYELVV